MRVTAALSANLLVSSSAAIPTPSIISSILCLLTNDINALLSALGIKIRTDGTSHSATVKYHNQCPFPVPAVTLSNDRSKHDITWAKDVSGSNFVNWKTFKANGANLGGSLEKERIHEPVWWESVGGGAAADEWTIFSNLGSKCGPVLEERYGSFLNTNSIDKLASVGINTLRIPTTYAALFAVPGSKLYKGNQQSFLRTIAQYVITKYNMHSESPFSTITEMVASLLPRT